MGRNGEEESREKERERGEEGHSIKIIFIVGYSGSK